MLASAAPESNPAVRPPWAAVHFVGVGGVSMSGLAAALAAIGVPVSGSDVADSVRTRRLAAAGVRVRLGHCAAAVEALPPGSLVVHNTDVPPDNPELVAARGLSLAVAHRSVVLDWFLRARARQALAVTGTHGKTTTTAMAAACLTAGGLDPTVFVGAEVEGLEGGNYRLGGGVVAVAEADESDGSFLRYSPDVALATNVEPEHLEHYGGSFEQVVAAYAVFFGRVREGGVALVSADDPRLVRLATGAPRIETYGLSSGADLRAVDLHAGPSGTAFTVRRRQEPLGTFHLAVPGRHNVANALAALGAGLHFGLAPEVCAQALAAYRGAGRRFEVLAQAGGITIVDDYAHHPTEVAATLRAARERGARRVLAVFQPHRYQRTGQLWDDFGPAFRDCDRLFLTEIYGPAGEERVQGVSGAALADLVARRSGVAVSFHPGLDDLSAAVVSAMRPGDLVLVMGAGDVTTVAARLAAEVRQQD